MGTIKPCTSRIQVDEKPSPGYARNVTLLMSVAMSDMPIAQAGMEPRDTKYFLVEFCPFENFMPIVNEMASATAIII